jgi:hypothetical protein
MDARNCKMQHRVPGATVVVLGGGPSVTAGTLETLRRAKGVRPFLVIGCNDALFHATDLLDFHLFCDTTTWLVHRRQAYLQAVAKEIQIEFFCCNTLTPTFLKATTYHLPRDKNQGIADFPACAFNASTGGAALGLMLALKASKIILVGFDMRKVDGKSNWYTNFRMPKDTSIARHLRALDKLAIVSSEKCPASRVVNSTPGSACKSYPFGELEGELL